MITKITKYRQILEAKNSSTDLIICDVQKSFSKYFTNTYLLELKDYCEDFQRVHQIYDVVDDTDQSYYFPNQVNNISKKYGAILKESDIEHYFIDDETKRTLFTKFQTGFDIQDKFETSTGDYFIYIDGQHEWFYCEKKLVDFFKYLAEHDRIVTLVGGAEGECLFDIYESARSFGVNIQYNLEYTYSSKGSKFLENDSTIELDKYLNIIEKENESNTVHEYEEIPDDMYIDQIIDVFTDYEEVKESLGDKLKTTDLTNRQVDRNDIIWITCYLKPRNNSGAYPLGEMGVIKCKVLETFYGLNKLKQLKKTDKIL